MNTRKIPVRGVAGGVIVLLLYVVYWAAFHGEDYCWWYPEIDTVFSQGFSKAGFDKIQVGMTADEVVGLVGDPFGKYPDKHNPDMEVWWFSHDGALGRWGVRWGDKAWFSYEVTFTNNYVSAKKRKIYYD